jgi:hypothetical protein
VTIENLYKLTPELKNAIRRHPASTVPSVTGMADKGTGAGRPLAASGKTIAGITDRFRCHQCGHESRPLAAIERHCHGAGHLRYEWVWR